MPVGDLIAQSLMALFALGQLGLTGVGIWYIRETLTATKAAVNEAADATDAARQAVSVTRLSAERQLRAYLTVDTIKVGDLAPGKRPIAWITLHNRGQTPARRIMIRDAATWCFNRNAEEANAKFCPARACHDLGPGQANTYPTILADEPITSEDLERMKDGRINILVAGYTSYVDVFGRTRRNTFRCQLTKGSFDDADKDGFLPVSLIGSGGKAS